MSTRALALDARPTLFARTPARRARRSTRALAQAASHRMMAHKSRKFHGNIHRRGAVDAGTTKKKDFSVGPVMLGFFVFVVVGSSILQVLRSASSGPLGGASAM